jgi:hypothetical protein
MSESVLGGTAEAPAEAVETPVEGVQTPVEGSVPTTPQTPVQGQSSDAGTKESYYRGLYDETGKINPEAWGRLPEHLKEGAKTFERFKSIDDLLGTLLHQKQALSKGGFTRPDENAPQEVKDAFSQKMRELSGSPENSTDYDFARPEDLPEQIQWSEDVAKEAQELMFKHGASPELANDVKALYAKMEQANYEQTLADYRVKEEAYFKEMGEQAKGIGQDALNTMRTLGFTDEQAHQLVNYAVASGIGPETVRNLASLKDKISPDKFYHGDQAGAVISTNGKSYREMAQDAGSRAADAYASGNRAEGDRLTKEEESYLQMAIRNKEI